MNCMQKTHLGFCESKEEGGTPHRLATQDNRGAKLGFLISVSLFGKLYGFAEYSWKGSV